VQQLVIPTEADVTGHVVDSSDVAGTYLITGHGHHAVGAATGHVLAGNAAVDGADLDSSHALCALHGLVDCASRLFDVSHDSAPYSTTPLDSQAQDLRAWITGVSSDLRDNGDDLGGSEIQRRDQALRLTAHAPARTMT
jgi:hypothetical protein